MRKYLYYGSWLSALAFLTALVVYAPVWDIAVSRFFFEKGHFMAEGNLFLKLMDKGIPEFWVGIAALIGLVWLWGRFNGCRWVRFVDTKFMLMTTGTMILGPFVIVNFIFKSFWGRARPYEIDTFGGDKIFSRPLEISDQCRWDCSFMSGHTAVSFWVLALALMVPKKYRLFAIAVVLIAGVVSGLSRMVQGYHFLSDVVFSAAVTSMVVILTYRELYRERV